MSNDAAAKPELAGAQTAAQSIYRLAGLGGLLVRLLPWIDTTKRRALTALAIRVTGAALAYIMQIVLAQWLGLTEYGIFVTVWVWLLVLGGISPLGLNVSVIGLLSKFHDRADFSQWRGVLVSSFAMTLSAGALVAGTGWTTLYLYPELLEPRYLIPVWLCLFCVPIMALTDLNEGVARAHGWMNTALAPTYLLRPALLIGGAFVTLQMGITLTAASAMSLAILACVITLVAQTSIIAIRLRRINRGRSVVARPVTWLSASVPIVVAQTFEVITQNFDMLAVSYFMGPEATGVYFAALKTIALLAFVNFAIGAATANNVASLHAAGRQAELEALLRTANNLSFWPSALGAIVVVLLAPVLLSLFGKDFAGHSYLTAILAFGFVAKSFVGPAELYLNVLGQQKICAAVLLVAAALNIGLNIVLIPSLGLLGAALATTVSLVLLSIGLFVVARNRIGISLMPSLPRIMPRAAGAKFESRT